MADVVDLSSKQLRVGQPMPEVVAMLERLLERAKTGGVVGVAYACAYADGTFGNGWDKGTHDVSFVLGNAISVLSYRYFQSQVDSALRRPQED